MIIRIMLLLLLCTVWIGMSAQSEKNYILEINGDTIHVSLNETAVLKTKDNKSLTIKLARKEFLQFQNEFFSFNYPSQFSVTSSKIDEDVDQILLMTATGNGIMIQTYNSINPELIVDFMLKQITEDDIAAGYKEVTTSTERKLSDGTVFKGKKSILTLDSDKGEFVVVGSGKRKKGMLVVEIKNDVANPEDEKIFEVFWKSLVLKY